MQTSIYSRHRFHTDVIRRVPLVMKELFWILSFKPAKTAK